jgi:GDPmannose 4,6-dehydratase
MGNIDTFRDESHAKDMVRGMWMMLQQATPRDFVLGSGETHSIREMLEYVCSLAELDPNKILEIDPSLYRPAEVYRLEADTTKARTLLGWKPQYSWKDLLKEMYENDLKG